MKLLKPITNKDFICHHCGSGQRKGFVIQGLGVAICSRCSRKLANSILETLGTKRFQKCSTNKLPVINNKPVTIFVYGSLKLGFYNNRGWEMYKHGKFKGCGYVTGFSLWDYGSYPGITKDLENNSKVFGEVWEVPHDLFTGLDRMETGAMYQQDAVTVDRIDGTKTKAILWFSQSKSDTKIENGFWNKKPCSSYHNINGELIAP